MGKNRLEVFHEYKYQEQYEVHFFVCAKPTC